MEERAEQEDVGKYGCVSSKRGTIPGTLSRAVPQKDTFIGYTPITHQELEPVYD